MRRILSFLSKVERKIIAQKIIDCFNDVDLKSNTFVVNGVTLENVNNETMFFERKDIEKVIKNINSLADELRGSK